jgi:hypothetical protein
MRDQRSLSIESEVELLGFALGDCIVEIDPESAKYLRAVHRTALELAVPNQFGVEVGGFWLMADQISQLRKLPEYYFAGEAHVVAKIVETYLSAQLDSFYKDFWVSRLR